MADTDKEPGAPSTEPRVRQTGGDGAVSDAAKKAQVDEAADEGAGAASVPVEKMTTANDK